MNKPLKHIGPYAIDGELGRGGMGVVYQAKDTRLDRLVAIKSLHENVLADPDSLPPRDNWWMPMSSRVRV